MLKYCQWNSTKWNDRKAVGTRYTRSFWYYCI